MGNQMFEDFCLFNNRLSPDEFCTKVVNEITELSKSFNMGIEEFAPLVNEMYGIQLENVKWSNGKVKFSCHVEQLTHISQNRTRYQTPVCV